MGSSDEIGLLVNRTAVQRWVATLDAPARSRLCPLGTTAGAVIAGTHLIITPEHLDEAAYLGLLFTVLSCVMIGVGVGLLRRDALWLWALGGMACAAAIVAYVISRSIGLPLAADDIGRWADPIGIVALSAEGLFVVLAVMAIRRALRAGAARYPVR